MRFPEIDAGLPDRLHQGFPPQLTLVRPNQYIPEPIPWICSLTQQDDVPNDFPLKVPIVFGPRRRKLWLGAVTSCTRCEWLLCGEAGYAFQHPAPASNWFALTVPGQPITAGSGSFAESTSACGWCHFPRGTGVVALY